MSSIFFLIINIFFIFRHILSFFGEEHTKKEIFQLQRLSFFFISLGQPVYICWTVFLYNNYSKMYNIFSDFCVVYTYIPCCKESYVIAIFRVTEYKQLKKKLINKVKKTIEVFSVKNYNKLVSNTY